jgi:zinc and cadmium transporter
MNYSIDSPNYFPHKNSILIYLPLSGVYNTVMFFLIILSTFLASIVSLLIVTVILTIKRMPKSWTLALTSFATGTLLATAFLDLLPEAITQTDNISSIMIWPLVGMILFFLFEQFFHWYHYHRAHGDIKPSVWLITIGDGLHNFIDGVAISAAFLTNIHLGIVTSVAVFAHEIPHEVADVSVYIHEGLTKKKTLLFNLGSGITALIGALFAYFLAKDFSTMLPAINAFTAGNFIYIAGSDLIPELHHVTDKKVKPWFQVLMFITGILMVALLKPLLG